MAEVKKRYRKFVISVKQRSLCTNLNNGRVASSTAVKIVYYFINLNYINLYCNMLHSHKSVIIEYKLIIRLTRAL